MSALCVGREQNFCLGNWRSTSAFNVRDGTRQRDRGRFGEMPEVFRDLWNRYGWAERPREDRGGGDWSNKAREDALRPTGPEASP